jgi:hypothetical protein
MRYGRKTLVACAAVAALSGPVSADVTSDQAAAIVNFPLVVVSPEFFYETVLQLSNTSEAPIDARCFYENANSHCDTTGAVCNEASDCCDGENGCGICLPGWNEVDFNVRLTPRQPLGWVASEGLAEFPIDGIVRTGSDGSDNGRSRIPPVPEEPFVGLLKCIAVDDEGRPSDRNVLKGEATLIGYVAGEGDVGDVIDVAKYNAVGIQAIDEAVNDDNVLVLGGEEPEYNGCPNVTIVNHFFDFAHDPVTDGQIVTLLTLAPCTQDLLRQVPGSAVVQYLVYNEFEQRFSTSRSMDCQQFLPMSLIDTTQPRRSIFSAGVSGTLTGQTRLTPIGSGLLAVALEGHDVAEPQFGNFLTFGARAAFNVHFQGDRADADLITLP